MATRPRLLPNSSTHEINSFLKLVNIPGIRVHLTIIEHRDKKARSLRVLEYKNKIIKAGWPLEDVEVALKEYQEGGTLSSALRSIRQARVLIMLSSPELKDNEGDKINHIQLYILRERVVCPALFPLAINLSYYN